MSQAGREEGVGRGEEVAGWRSGGGRESKRGQREDRRWARTRLG